jgi:hypothetical protein
MGSHKAVILSDEAPELVLKGVRVSVLWTRLSGYLNATLRALSDAGAELMVVNQTPVGDAPFDSRLFAWIASRVEYDEQPDYAELVAKVKAFQPTVILASWHISEYQAVCRLLRRDTMTVGCADNQWSGSIRQRLGAVLSGVYLRRNYEFMFVAGERQVQWAEKMGYRSDRILRGLYCCDPSLFREMAGMKENSGRRAFGFVGRLVNEKGISDLLLAYQRYRATAKDPWDLVVAGAGPLAKYCSEVEGVELRGFLQPDGLASFLAGLDCFLMASRFDPWCVGIQEAAAVGLPIICTSACGASVHLVQDCYNGYVVAPAEPDQLADAMRRVSNLTEVDRRQMAQRSQLLASQFSSSRFIDTLLSGLDRRR